MVTLDPQSFLHNELIGLAKDLKASIALQKASPFSISSSLWKLAQVGCGTCTSCPRKDPVKPPIEKTAAFANPSAFKPSAAPLKNPSPPRLYPEQKSASSEKTNASLAPLSAKPQPPALPVTDSKKPSAAASIDSEELSTSPSIKKENKKIGSFILEPAPLPAIYDLQGPEKWFQAKGLAAKGQELLSIKKTLAPKSTKLCPIAIIYSPTSPYLAALEKLQAALNQRFMPCQCYCDNPIMRQNLLDAIECKRLVLLLLDPSLEELDALLKHEQTRQLEKTQLEEPARKLELWKWIEAHLAKPH